MKSIESNDRNERAEAQQPPAKQSVPVKPTSLWKELAKDFLVGSAASVAFVLLRGKRQDDTRNR